MSVTDILNSIMPSNMPLGFTSGAGFGTFKAVNVIGGRITYAGLPTSDPAAAGSGTVGALKVT